MPVTSGPMRSIRPARQRAKVAGWASFDAQQRGGVPKAGVDPFPPLPPPSSSSSHNLQKKQSQRSVIDNNSLNEKNAVSAVVRHEDISFMSVNSRAKPCKGFAQLIDKVAVKPRNFIDPHPNTSLASTTMLHGVTDHVNHKKVAVEKLQSLYNWADENLIEDILMAVNYNLEQASASLESMAVMELPENLDPSDAYEAVEKSQPDNICEGKSCPLLPECLGFENLHVTSPRGGHTPTAPPEPEWEEEDVYSKHRKEALRRLRAAERHSKEAERAYLRGDHRTARNMSLKSQEEHLAADKLNAKAAVEILQIRNEKLNDIWKLDLHGLHASEAVQALESRLEMIEYNTSAPSDPETNQKGNIHTEQKSSGLLTLRTWRPSELQVITGVGVHSRGGAALPIAIKNFLIDKGYKFSEARAGVIAVRPKFRYK